ncbi:Squalene synthase [hydrothermal vent metagenome]|uniref:Squalene synthase n=1 Tax=hydrothermal vent metagenome TaxID=652676 RepID=A0A3B0YBW8_9ZZZZ
MFATVKRRTNPRVKPTKIASAYRWCRQLTQSHYENFPVASILLPAWQRDPIAAIYAFARSADDIADEGDADETERLQQLDAMSTALHAITQGSPPEQPVYIALADTLERHALPIELFHDLLSAFRQDVTCKRYANFGELMDYCRRSANPVGRLLLHLNGQASEKNLARSDAICSALQLINFLQDIHQDYEENNRIYLPQDEMQKFTINEEAIRERHNSFEMKELIRFQIQRTSKLLRAGSPLGMQLRGRFGLELRAIILGGARVLEKLHAQDDVFARPRLDRREHVGILFSALRQGFSRH